MSSSNIVSFPSHDATSWIEEFQQACLLHNEPVTIRIYLHILHHFTQWAMKRGGKTTPFQPEQHVTPAIIEQYLTLLVTQGSSPSHCKRVKSVIHQFCQWLIEEKGCLRQNPTRTVILERPPSVSPRPLTPAQRYILQALMKQEDCRGKALFALGYWAGCRVMDIIDLPLSHAHVGAKSGWLRLEEEGGKSRDIDLTNEARRLLYDYLQHREREEGSPYVFLSQRGPQLSDAGLHHWFRALKHKATPQDQQLIAEIRFHDLRHDFAYRAQDAGWTLEEIAYYLGHTTVRGTPALQTTMQYAQMTRAQIKDKLRTMKG